MENNLKTNRMKVSFPYNNEWQTIINLINYSEVINDLYLPCDINFMASGRSWKFKEADYFSCVSNIIKELKPHGIQVNLLLNATCRPENLYIMKGVHEIINYITELLELGLGMITISDIILAKQIRYYLPNLTINISTNALVHSVIKAKIWEQEVGANSVCLDRDINKRIDLIENIKKYTKMRIIMLLNDPCLPDCPSKMHHMNMFCHPPASKDKKMNYKDWCLEVFKYYPWLVYSTGMVTPYNLRHFKGLVDVVKISGRDVKTSLNFKVLGHYLTDSSAYITSSGIRIEEPPEVFKKVSRCNRSCFNCDYCKSIYNQIHTNN